MKNIEERIDDWQKLKNECSLMMEETNPEIKKMYQANLYAGIKMYFEKYHEKFDFWNIPKEEGK